MKVSLIAMGAGAGTLTLGALAALQRAGLILGAPRLLELVPDIYKAKRVSAVRTEDLLQLIEESQEENIAAVFSGDVGFYSGACLLSQRLEEKGIEWECMPGVSSVQLLAAHLGCPWQDWALISAHGRACDPVLPVMQGKSVLFLTGGENTAAVLCQKLTAAGLGALPVCAGQNLGMPEEKILRGTAQQLAESAMSPLTVLLTAPLESPYAEYGPALPDEVFERSKVPMTKQSVRAVILSQLHPEKTDVCWDVGGGTGSVAIMLSRAAGRVYSVETNPEAFALMQKNREKLGAWNMTALLGTAPEALEDLPRPDKVFIGGSKGNLPGILQVILAKNPAARICASAVTLETLHTASRAMQKQGLAPRITQVSVSESKVVGSLHMMLAQNPVWLITGGKP